MLDPHRPHGLRSGEILQGKGVGKKQTTDRREEI